MRELVYIYARARVRELVYTSAHAQTEVTSRFKMAAPIKKWPPPSYLDLMGDNTSFCVFREIREICDFRAQYLSPQSPYSQKTYIFTISASERFRLSRSRPDWTLIGRFKFFYFSATPCRSPPPPDPKPVPNGSLYGTLPYM